MKITFSWFVLGIIGAVTVYFTIQTITSGALLVNFERQEANLVGKNQALSGELVRSTSLISIEEAAEELGFAKPEKIIYITQQDSVAKLP